MDCGYLCSDVLIGISKNIIMDINGTKIPLRFKSSDSESLFILPFFIL